MWQRNQLTVIGLQGWDKISTDHWKTPVHGWTSAHSHSLASRRLAVDFGMEETVTQLLMKHHLRWLGHSACMEHYHWYRISPLVEQHRAGFQGLHALVEKQRTSVWLGVSSTEEGTLTRHNCSCTFLAHWILLSSHEGSRFHCCLYMCWDVARIMYFHKGKFCISRTKGWNILTVLFKM